MSLCRCDLVSARRRRKPAPPENQDPRSHTEARTPVAPPPKGTSIPPEGGRGWPQPEPLVVSGPRPQWAKTDNRRPPRAPPARGGCSRQPRSPVPGGNPPPDPDGPDCTQGDRTSQTAPPRPGPAPTPMPRPHTHPTPGRPHHCRSPPHTPLPPPHTHSDSQTHRPHTHNLTHPNPTPTQMLLPPTCTHAPARPTPHPPHNPPLLRSPPSANHRHPLHQTPILPTPN
ncbi:basic proline-rich protein-like [Cyprinodon tularosa]|uniref:basic proline-rich protein-like n=1 Tax=Cyprinodon tularosa TaxID=77115 RepID=UPI0018E2212C|nr:basic proline-rich protein-like [Cyprinodon tularosa]